MNRNSVLVMIVGTGRIEDLESEKGKKQVNSYMESFRYSIEKANAKNLILLHSDRSIIFKDILEREFKGKNYNVECVEVDAFNEDKVYQTCYNLLQDKYKNKHKIMNITHGTKPMAIALFEAGMHYEDTVFMYNEGKKNPDGELIFPENGVKIIDVFEARMVLLYKQCKNLFANHQYAAVKNIINNLTLPDELSKETKEKLDKLKNLSDFCVAWDRFDYRDAAEKLENCLNEITDVGYKISEKKIEKCREYFEILQGDIKEPGADGILSEENRKHNIGKGIYLLFDLYANYKRRRAAGLYEDAGIRVYRMAELMGQICLFKHGYCSDRMPVKDENVEKFMREETEFKDKKFNDKTELRLGRGQVLDFLGSIRENTDILGTLNNIEEDVQQRNHSVLIHGYSTLTKVAESFDKNADEILKLANNFIEDYELENYDVIRETAMFLNNNFK